MKLKPLSRPGRTCRSVAESFANRLSCCGVAARSPEKGRLLQKLDDGHLIGAEITFGATPIGHVEGVVRDPLSQRVRRLITSYGLVRRRVAVPMEWVVKRSASRVVLGVGARSLDDLRDLTPA